VAELTGTKHSLREAQHLAGKSLNFPAIFLNALEWRNELFVGQKFWQPRKVRSNPSRLVFAE